MDGYNKGRYTNRVDNSLEALSDPPPPPDPPGPPDPPCHNSYSGYYDTDCCDGNYCEQNGNCVSNCCWNSRCDPAEDNCFGPSGNSSNLTWLWCILSISAVVCCGAILFVIIARRKRQRREHYGGEFSETSTVVTSQ